MSITENEMVELLFPYVSSVLGVKNGKYPEFIGSGILLKGHEGLYLVTAAHVMDHFGKNESPLFLNGIEGLVQVSGEEVCSYTEDLVNRGDDRHDISIVKLDNEISNRLDPVSFINHEKVDTLGEHEPYFGYFCVGIPAKRGDKSVDENNMCISPEPYGLYAEESNNEIYRKLTASSSTHLALNFDLKKAFSKENIKRTAPALNGLSGAPIWGFRRKSSTELQAVVVAILTEYHQKNIKSILGTRVGEVFRGVLL